MAACLSSAIDVDVQPLGAGVVVGCFVESWWLQTFNQYQIIVQMLDRIEREASTFLVSSSSAILISVPYRREGLVWIQWATADPAEHCRRYGARCMLR